MNAPLHHARLHPVLQRFAVTLLFTSGIYKRDVDTHSSERAKELALIDARMASSFSQHSGDLISSHAEVV